MIQAGSTRGLGRRADSSSSPCHWRGSPVKRCSEGSYPVCTRCSKLDGAEISTRFFFLENMARDALLAMGSGPNIPVLGRGKWEPSSGMGWAPEIQHYNGECHREREQLPKSSVTMGNVTGNGIGPQNPALQQGMSPGTGSAPKSRSIRTK